MRRHTLTERTQGDRSLRTTTEYSWKTVQNTSAEAHFPYIAEAATLREELTGATSVMLSKATHAFTVDDYHNVRRIESQWNSGDSELQEADYEHDSSPAFLDSWLVSLPGRVTHKSTAAGATQGTVTRTWQMRHLANGALDSVAAEPASQALGIESVFIRDVFGNPVVIRQYSKGKARQRTIHFEGRGVFPRSVIDEEGYKTEYDFHHGNGQLTRTRELGKAGSGTGGLDYLSLYDGFGRMRLAVAPDGTESRRSYEQSTGPYTPLSVTTEVPGGGAAVARFDPLGRQVGGSFTTYNGVKLESWQRYDVFGRPFDTTRPTSGTSDVKTKFSYDDAGRLLQVTYPDSSKQTYCYRANVACTKDARGYIRCVERDERRRTRALWDPSPTDTNRTCEDVADALAKSLEQRGGVRVRFGSHNQVVRVDYTSGPSTLLARDTLGRVYLRYDPGASTRSFTYGAFGNLESETDAHGIPVNYTHDLLDRPTSRTDPSGATTWQWSNVLQGSLESNGTPQGVQTTLGYDAFGRPQTETRSVGAATLKASIDSRDQFGRPTVVAYPSGPGQPALRVQLSYDAFGNQTEVSNADSGQVYWKFDAVDEFGQIVEEKLGTTLTTKRKFDQAFGRVVSEETSAAAPIDTRKYKYDLVGNLDTGEAPDTTGTWGYKYDEFNRLVQEKNGSVLTYAYSPSGNLTNKSGVGTYSYTHFGKPHAVSSVSSGGATQSFGYDSVGNMTTRSGTPLAPLTLEYTSFDKPFRVFSASATEASEFTYDADHVRASKQRPGEARIYFPGMYVASTTATGTDERFSIAAAGQLVAEVVRVAGAEQVTYLLSDRLGSVEAIADGQGTVLERRSYDSFGRKKTTSTTAGFSGTRLGYGGHESDDEHGLVNMGGRIYDPTLGRFTSADPFVPTADSQGWNRYSYVLNNPLTLTDPSGFDPACDNLSPLCSAYAGSTGGGHGGGEAVSEIIRTNNVSVYHSGFAGTDASNLAAGPPNGTLPGFSEAWVASVTAQLGGVTSSPLFEAGPIVPTPGAAWFGIDTFNNGIGRRGRAGGVGATRWDYALPRPRRGRAPA